MGACAALFSILLGALSSTSANWLRLRTMKGSLMNSIRHEADSFGVPTIECKSVQKVSNVPFGPGHCFD